MNKDELTRSVTGSTIDILQKFGNDVSSDHRLALYSVASRFANAVFGVQERTAIALDTGLGKTTTVMCVLSECHKHGLEFPVLVYVPNLDAMQSMRDGLVAMGIPEKLVGLVFNVVSIRKEHRMLPTKREDWADCPILIACHARADVRRTELNETLVHGSGKRTIIHDESLRKGTAITVEQVSLFQQADTVRRYLDKETVGASRKLTT